MRLSPSAALAAALAFAPLASAARVVVPTDLGWRTAVATLSCAYPTPTGAGVQCQGLSEAAEGDASAAACAAAACARRAAMWQWAPARGCWAGSPPTLNCTAQGTDPEAWVGAYTAAAPGGAPPPDAPEAQPAFDDAAWRVVDTPHDATVEGAYSKTANRGEGYLPPVVQWYRKRFFAPAAWAGSAVTLTLDGALSTSTFWLNGQQLVVARPSGYLPLSLRLDGAAGLRFGAANVFAAFIDGSETTGWWCVGARRRRAPTVPARAP